MNRYFLTGFCNQKRTTGISNIEKIVSEQGYILDFKRFSDLSLSLTIEIPERKVDLLYRSLTQYMAMNDFTELNSQSSKTCFVLLNVAFQKGSGDLKNEVPAIPG